MAQEEEARLATEQVKKKAEVEIKELKKDIDELEIAVSKVILKSFSNGKLPHPVYLMRFSLLEIQQRHDFTPPNPSLLCTAHFLIK